MDRQTCDCCHEPVGDESFDFLVTVTSYTPDGDIEESLHEVPGDTYLVICTVCHDRYVKRLWDKFACKVRTGKFKNDRDGRPYRRGNIF